MKSSSMAALAMQAVEKCGFSYSRALAECEFGYGKVVFGNHVEPPKEKGLWVVVKFTDGSMMNIYKKGCAVFDPSVGVTAFEQLPRVVCSRLY